MEKLLTTTEMAEKWGISSRRIAVLCGEGRVDGALKKGKTWLIPENTEKPQDARIRQNRKLRVFEAFAGIGAQDTALERIGINYEIVGISEWFIDALHCYDILHNDQSEEIEVPSQDEQIKYLSQFTFSKDSTNETKLSLLKPKEIEKLYIANKRCKNYGSISEINGYDLPDMDLLVYSFPCQDLSTGGNCRGMSKDSGTRSGLLWEVERILRQLNEENRLPEYLLMENVTTITADSNINDLNQWLNFLESIGYENDECMKLNAVDFGVPQNRNRAFIVSHLGSKLNTSEKLVIEKKEYNISDYLKYDYTNPIYKSEADEAQLKRTPSREIMWKNNGMEINEDTIINTITCNMDRTHCAGLFLYDGKLGNTYRRPTIREAFLMMGFTEEEYEKTLNLGYSYRKMNKLIGNSIVVDVLAAVFRAMFEGSNFYDNSAEQGNT